MKEGVPGMYRLEDRRQIDMRCLVMGNIRKEVMEGRKISIERGKRKKNKRRVKYLRLKEGKWR